MATIIDADFYTVRKNMTCPADGELYLIIRRIRAPWGVRICRTLNHGVNWQILYEGILAGTSGHTTVCNRSFGNYFIGDEYYCLFVTTDFITFTERKIDVPLESLDKCYDIFVTPYSHNQIWISGRDAADRDAEAYSISAGATFDWQVGIGSHTDYSRRTRMSNSAPLHGIKGDAGASGWDVPMYWNGAAWVNTASPYRCSYPGYDGTTALFGLKNTLTVMGISVDHGATVSDLVIPVGMQGGSWPNYYPTMSVKGNTFAVSVNNGNDPGIWMSWDLGVNWTKTLDVAILGTWTTICVEIDPFDADIVFAWGDNGMWRSTDGGVTWVGSGVIGVIINKPVVTTLPATDIT